MHPKHQPNTALTIQQAMLRYLESVRLARSENTVRTYSNALSAFSQLLEEYHLSPEKTLVEELPEDAIAWFAAYLKIYASATERLYLSAVAGLYEFLAAECLSAPNLPRLHLLVRQRSRRSGPRLPQFPRDAIDDILDYAINLTSMPTESEKARLILLRDRSFLITLADTGLRVHEACALRRGDIDWNEGRAVIIGKGDRQAVVRFSRRAIEALREYQSARAAIDGSSGRPLASLPVFTRHDKGAGKKVLPITTTTGRNIVAQHVQAALGIDAVGNITPHSFRHYFVTKVLQGSGNLKLAQELARHRNIQVTQRYAHLSDDELDKGYYEVFEER